MHKVHPPLQARHTATYPPFSNSSFRRQFDAIQASSGFMDLCVDTRAVWDLWGSPYRAWTSSRLMKATSVFAHQVEVRDEGGKGALVYGFSEKPERTMEVNWSTSSYLFVGSYSQKGYSLWLNKGSKICVRWATQASRLDKTEVTMIKGAREEVTLLPILPSTFDGRFLNEAVTGKEAEFTIDEDDEYHVGVINSNPIRIVMSFSLNVTSKVYDVSKAGNVCSTLNGTCWFDLQFPNTQYVIVAAADNADINGRYVELSFAARVVSYIALLGTVYIFK